MLNERPNANSRKAMVTVADTKGLILLPDEWTAPSGITVTEGHTYNDSQWTVLEEAGAVFLPAAGKFNDGLSLEDVGTTGYYWSSSPSDEKTADSVNDAYVMSFSSSTTPASIISRRMGAAVRLVMPIDGSVTGIQGVTVTPIRRADNNWYTLDGRRLSATPTQRGIYIHGGTKVVIK
jgi:hypothetical protein